MSRILKRAALTSILVSALYALWRAMQRRHAERGVEWEAAPFPFPPVPRPSSGTTDQPEAPNLAEAWVEPLGGVCPDSHPVKAKLGSGIFHVRGGRSYDRTNADRCYCDESAALADGLRAAKA